MRHNRGMPNHQSLVFPHLNTEQFTTTHRNMVQASSLHYNINSSPSPTSSACVVVPVAYICLLASSCILSRSFLWQSSFEFFCRVCWSSSSSRLHLSQGKCATCRHSTSQLTTALLWCSIGDYSYTCQLSICTPLKYMTAKTIEL